MGRRWFVSVVVVLGALLEAAASAASAAELEALLDRLVPEQLAAAGIPGAAVAAVLDGEVVLAK